MKKDDLSRYRAMRDFESTAEPPGKQDAKAKKKLSFVVQRHNASHLHYDFRLELDGVLKSWAVPKGPSLIVGDKRLAVQVEDHPLDYGGFEGSIPEGEYGGGHVLVWDAGTWEPRGDPHEGIKKGNLKFDLKGKRLNGGFALVRMKPRGGKSSKPQWLLLKEHDRSEKKAGSKLVTEHAPIPALKTFVPELATLADALPEGEGWIVEPKLDGYRVIAALEAGKVQLMSRNGKDWSKPFAPIRDAVAELAVSSIVVDGEVCALDERGIPSFNRLQNSVSESTPGARLAYFIFDLLFFDGEDLRNRPLKTRKAILESILREAPASLSFVRSVTPEEGKELLANACTHGMEGVVVKREDRPYVSGRGKDWLKVKCNRRQEMVIVGFSAPKGSRSGLGALLLAVAEKNGTYRYAGRVGTGFSAKMLASLRSRLNTLTKGAKPAVGAPKTRDATWVRPELVAEVSFSEWTADGALRHPSFIALREDKKPSEVVREKSISKAAPRRAVKAKAQATKKALEKRKAVKSESASEGDTVLGVRITHPDRMMDRKSQLTKLDLARYHEAVMTYSLPYMINRPLSLFRCPEGDGAECFFQKRRTPGMSDSIHEMKIGKHPILYVDSAEGAMSVVQFGAVELHAWGSIISDPDRPDWLVMDLDPDASLPFKKVVEAAQAMRDLFLGMGLQSFVKTTGGKGLHVVVPIVPKHDFEAIKEFTHAIATKLAADQPKIYTATSGKKNRAGGRIFVDYLRNGQGATAVLPYSPRARPGAPVSFPVGWRDLAKVDPADFTVATVPAVLKKRKTDPWAKFFTLKQRLP